MAGELPEDFDAKAWDFIKSVDAKAEKIATRKASQNAINGFGPMLPELLGGSADLAGSNLTLWKGARASARAMPRATTSTTACASSACRPS
jgi:transketolase